MQVRALHKWVRISPSKVRRYCDMVRGKPVAEAIRLLEVEPSPSARELLRALKSAVANAENNAGADADELTVKQALATDAIRLRRLLPRARGRAEVLRKRSCHITVVVTDGQEEKG